MIYVLIAIVFLSIAILIRMFRKPIVIFLLKIRSKLQIASLRFAIKAADDDKQKTDRKNMVAYNTVSGKFETLQKKTLKTAANAKKKKNNAKKTEGRQWAQKNRLGKHGIKKRSIDPKLIKQIEKDSLYVTN